ncbi:Arc family DNA-binding protein [Sinorhizobium medicae]|nr:Arc family DNA-binding protein [Sinorhizobium medicae]MDX0855972.1 Arc family DNA-binding protein [Sinorhizobium medicae]MDX0907416.1 Arc family DNA-binding protein [Sinorhizobium medicae]MDX1165011.1 Arc family DNA-binding protein [Sinorhizobium medicae]MDX1210865.1 Arc family DNA-binding protein [Sinorhizobium medicae]
MTSNTGRDSDKFMLRFPNGMRDRLKEEAAKNGRSMNAEIVHRLEASLAVGNLSPEDFLGIQQMENENAQRLADALRRIAYSVEMLGSGAIEVLADKPEDI